MQRHTDIGVSGHQWNQPRDNIQGNKIKLYTDREAYVHADMHTPHTKGHTEYKLRIGQNTNQKTEVKDTISNSIFKDVSIIYVKVHSMSFKN